MKKLTYALIILFCSAVSMTAVAQSAKTVAWRLTVKMTNDKEGIATLKATIDPGWHLYGTKLPSGGPHPTLINFSQSKGVELIGEPTVSPEPTSGVDKLFEMKLSWWENQVVWRQKFKLTNTSAAEIQCQIRYNTCNNQTCTMPVSETLSRKIVK